MTVTPERSRYLSGTSLDNPYSRRLLRQEMPDIPPEVVDGADPYLLAIIMAALLDGRRGGPDDPEAL